MTPVLFVALSGWIAYAQIKEHWQEGLVVAGVLALGGLMYAAFRRQPERELCASPDSQMRVVSTDPP